MHAHLSSDMYETLCFSPAPGCSGIAAFDLKQQGAILLPLQVSLVDHPRLLSGDCFQISEH